MSARTVVKSRPSANPLHRPSPRRVLDIAWSAVNEDQRRAFYLAVIKSWLRAQKDCPAMTSIPPDDALIQSALTMRAVVGRSSVHTVRRGLCLWSGGCERPRQVVKHPRTEPASLDATTDDAMVKRWWTECPDATGDRLPGPAWRRREVVHKQAGRPERRIRAAEYEEGDPDANRTMSRRHGVNRRARDLHVEGSPGEPSPRRDDRVAAEGGDPALSRARSGERGPTVPRPGRAAARLAPSPVGCGDATRAELARDRRRCPGRGGAPATATGTCCARGRPACPGPGRMGTYRVGARTPSRTRLNSGDPRWVSYAPDPSGPPPRAGGLGGQPNARSVTIHRAPSAAGRSTYPVTMTMTPAARPTTATPGATRKLRGPISRCRSIGSQTVTWPANPNGSGVESGVEGGVGVGTGEHPLSARYRSSR